jgi:hypothetical protein
MSTKLIQNAVLQYYDYQLPFNFCVDKKIENVSLLFKNYCHKSTREYPAHARDSGYQGHYNKNFSVN